MQNEPRPGQVRGVNRTYYFIDYRIAIDAIKWRVYKIGKDMQGTAVPASEVKEFFCNFCKASYTMLEVLDNSSEKGFVCQRCGRVLVHDRDRQSQGHQQTTRMNTQFRFITDLLPRIDSEVVPDITFDVAFSNHKPVERAETHKVERLDPMDSTYSRPAAVKGLANTGPTSISINIQSADSLSEEQKADERARKQAHLAANAMPAWYTKSTVTGETIQGMETSVPGDKLTKEEEDEKKRIRDAEAERLAKEKEDADLQAVFAKIRAEEEARQAAGGNDSDEDEDDDDDEFEDVVGTRTDTGAATPLSGAALGAAPVAPSPLRQSSTQPPSSLKREAPGSRTYTGARSPNGASPGVDERPVKRIKTEEEAPTPVPEAADDDEDDEDDIEFEDV